MNIYITVEDDTKCIDTLILDLPEWKGLFHAVDTLRAREAAMNATVRKLVDLTRHKYGIYQHQKTKEALVETLIPLKQLEALGYEVELGPSDAVSARRKDAVPTSNETTV